MQAASSDGTLMNKMESSVVVLHVTGPQGMHASGGVIEDRASMETLLWMDCWWGAGRRQGGNWQV